MNDEKIVTVQILNRDYRVKCQPEQQADLEEAASYINEKMQKLKQQSSSNAPDQIAVITALNICNDWLKLKKQYKQQVETTSAQLNKLTQRIEKAVGKKDEILV